MLKIDVISVGSLKERYLVNACNEYLKRLKPFCKINTIEVSEYKSFDLPSASQIKTIIENEGEYILKKLDARSFKVALCIEGSLISSEEMSKKISKLSTNGISAITFIIGGSYGLSEKVKKIADYKMSISPMTFTHQLTKIILLEQIYRSFAIQSKMPYHK